MTPTISTSHAQAPVKSNRFRYVLLLACSLILVACEPVKISQIKADPAKYQSKTVAVTGTVVNSIGVLARGGYEVDDGTGKIYVITSRGVPSSGARVSVEGTVFSGATILGQAMGVAIRETKHHVH
jgi:hypothetical protein